MRRPEVDALQHLAERRDLTPIRPTDFESRVLLPTALRSSVAPASRQCCCSKQLTGSVARPHIRERPTASAAISDSRQNAAAASRAQSVEHRKLHLRSRGCEPTSRRQRFAAAPSLEAVSEYAGERPTCRPSSIANHNRLQSKGSAGGGPEAGSDARRKAGPLPEPPVMGIFWISPVNGSFVRQSRRCGARCDRVGTRSVS